MDREIIRLGKWSEGALDALLSEAAGIGPPGERIAFLSKQFLGAGYKESTLIGDLHTPEVLVINLEAVDCFTLIDYIEALRLSASFAELTGNLKRVRYRTGKVSFETRNHFFTDWTESNAELIDDVTGHAGGGRVERVQKELNKKEDGACFLAGIAPRRRDLHYIPSGSVDSALLDRLETGDYIGIYSDLQGLDVSHVGICIRSGEKTYFRHASSYEGHRKVIDQDFMSYIAGKPGIIVLRPK